MCAALDTPVARGAFVLQSAPALTWSEFEQRARERSANPSSASGTLQRVPESTRPAHAAHTIADALAALVVGVLEHGDATGVYQTLLCDGSIATGAVNVAIGEAVGKLCADNRFVLQRESISDGVWYILHPKTGSVSTVRVCDTAIGILRGIGGDLVYAHGSAATSDDIVLQVLLPLLQAGVDVFVVV